MLWSCLAGVRFGACFLPARFVPLHVYLDLTALTLSLQEKPRDTPMTSDEWPPVIDHDDPRGPKPPCTATLLTPIQSIPAEIIREVFIFSLPRNLNYCQPHICTAPLQVSHVCSTWRRIALGTPQLWASVAINVGFLGHETEIEVVKRNSEVIRQWFSRAGQHQALSLQYLGTALTPSANLLGIILPYLNQLRELRVQLADALPLYTLLATAELERLEILDFLVLSDNLSGPQDRFSFWNASCLHKLIASFAYANQHLEDWRRFARWAQLTSLTLNFVDAQVWVPLLAECVNLQEGTFRVSALGLDDVPDLSQTVSVELKRLTFLDVSFDELRSIEIFDGFRFPNLTSFRIGGLTESSWLSPGHFYEQVKSLQSLSYQGSPVGLIELLYHTHSVVDLDISTSVTDLDLFFRAMQVKDEDKVLLPKLENLSLHDSTQSWPIQGLYDMLKSRTIGHTPPSVCPLKYFSIESGGSEPRCNCLRSLQVGGLPVLDLYMGCDCVLCCAGEETDWDTDLSDSDKWGC